MPILLTVLGFLWWWPLGLLILAFLIARGGSAAGVTQPMRGMVRCPTGSARGTTGSARWPACRKKWNASAPEWSASGAASDWFGPASSGNRAFDDYRAETLKRLEDEQREFKDFLARLRFAKDRAEFDQFMAERRQRPIDPDSQAGPSQDQPRD